MRAVTVYRVDYVRNTREPIGVILERRAREREGNFFGLLQLARRLFARDASDAIHIVIHGRDARKACSPEPATA